MAQDDFRLEINRVPIYNDGTIKYQLSAVCSVTKSTEANPIRLDQNVFVKLVSDSSFVRVANASDLGLLKSSLEAANTSGHSEYRDSVATFDFDDVDTAVAAIPVLRDRVNSTVYNYIKYIKRFQSTDEFPNVYSLPLASQDQEAKDAHILNYTDARQARQEAEQSLAEAQASLDAIGFKKEFVSDLKNKICSLETSLNTRYSSVSDANAAISSSPITLVGQVSNFFIENGSGDGYTITSANLTSIRTSVAILNDLVSQHLPAATATLSEAVGILNLECSRLTGHDTSYKNQTDAIAETLDSLASEVTDSSRVEASALADLAEYCPDVDPNEV